VHQFPIDDEVALFLLQKRFFLQKYQRRLQKFFEHEGWLFQWRLEGPERRFCLLVLTDENGCVEGEENGVQQQSRRMLA